MTEGKGHPRRGVSMYSYQPLLHRSMTLEDCFQEVYDTGATCFELLTSYIDNYPNPPAEWVDKYWRLCEKYQLQPAELGHWAESHLYRGPRMTDEQIVEQLKQDFRLANMLGFRSLRTKITCINLANDPEPGWETSIEKALPYAEKYDVVMQNEVHLPTTLHTPHIRDEYLEFIHRTGTRHFGFNIDFGTFQFQQVEGSAFVVDDYSKPEEIVDFLPYSYTCHAKFTNMNEDFEEVTIPYREVVQLMVDNGWNGNLLSEYEGSLAYFSSRSAEDYAKAMDGIPDQIRRHQIMLRNILGY